MRNNTFMFIITKFYFCFEVQLNLNYPDFSIIHTCFSYMSSSQILIIESTVLQKFFSFKLCDENPVPMLHSTN